MNRGSRRGPGLLCTTGRAASMRPRFMNRGSAVGGRVDHGSPRASMRPRFMNRGSAILRDVAPADPEALQ